MLTRRGSRTGQDAPGNETAGVGSGRMRTVSTQGRPRTDSQRSSAGPRSGSPAGRTIALWLAGALGAGLTTGVVAHLTRGPAPRPVAAPSLSTRVSPTAVAAVTATPAPSRSPSRSPSPTMPSPAADRWVSEPWATSGLELSSLKSAKRGDDGSVVITVDRLTFYGGAQAVAYYDKHPELERLDYAIVNQSSRIDRFTLVPDSPIFLGPMLGVTEPPQRSDGAHLVDGLSRLQQEGGEAFVWLRHDARDKGWATYLAEQFFP